MMRASTLSRNRLPLLLLAVALLALAALLSHDTPAVQAQASSNANLSALTVQGSTDGSTFAALTGANVMAPAFAAATLDYRVTVGNDVTHVKLTPTAADTGATVRVGRWHWTTLPTVTSGSASDAIELKEGDNEIYLRVTAEDGTERRYEVIVRRVPAAAVWHATLVVQSVLFGRALGCYSQETAAGLKCSTASVLTDDNLTYDGVDYEFDGITGGDGGLGLAFNKAIPAALRSALTFNGGGRPFALADANLSGTGTSILWEGASLTWSVGQPVSLSLTASPNADLSALALSSSDSATGTFNAVNLAPLTFSADTTSYTATVASDQTHVKLTPTVDDTGRATVEVGKAGSTLTTVTSGSASDAIALNLGYNAITVRVTAEDSTTRDYTVTITRRHHAYVSNMGQTEDDGATTGAWSRSQAFTTGPEVGAYTLGSVDVLTGATDITSAQRDAIRAELWTSLHSGHADAGKPDWKVADLTAPAHPIATDMVSFAAPPNTSLWAGTTYHFVIYTVGAFDMDLAITDSVAQDSSFAPGWSIADGLRSVQVDRPTALSSWGDEGDEALKISINAAPGSPNTNLGALAVSTSDSATGTFDAVTLSPPTFRPILVEYRATVASNQTHVRVTPTVEDTGKATVKVGRTGTTLTTVASGSASGAIPLSVGINDITMLVTAENGATKDYKVIITRHAPSSTAMSLTLEQVAVSGLPTFDDEGNWEYGSISVELRPRLDQAISHFDYVVVDTGPGTTAVRSPDPYDPEQGYFIMYNARTPFRPGNDVPTTIGQLWRGKLWVGNAGSSNLGCRNGASRACDGTFTLEDPRFRTYGHDEFTYRGTDYAITAITLNSGTLEFTVDTAFTPELLSTGDLTFEDATVNRKVFRFADAVVSNSNQTVTWSGTGLSWSSGNHVDISLGGNKDWKVNVSIYPNVWYYVYGTTHRDRKWLTKRPENLRHDPDHNIVLTATSERDGLTAEPVTLNVGKLVQHLRDGGEGTPCPACVVVAPTGSGATGIVLGSSGPPPSNYAALIADIRDWRNDPDYVNDKAHTDRWDRVLLAMGETVADQTLTPMTADEAQEYVDRGWERWEGVVEALRELENRAAPTVTNPMADITLAFESDTYPVSLAGVFDDPDGDALTFTAASDNEAVATVEVETDYPVLTVIAHARGTATITVTADDGNGGTVDDTCTVTVKAEPVVASAIDDISGLEVEDHRSISLTGVFSDPDGDALTVTATSSDDGKAIAWVHLGEVTVLAAAVGDVTITVTAEDSDGNTVSDTFDVEVVKKYAGLIAKIKEYRADPCCAHDKAHTDRWDRTLLAFGETVADQTLTKMPADEAQGYADQGWTRWTEVATALEEIESSAQQQAAPNRAPTVSSAIPDATIVNQSGTHQVSLSGVFADADNDALTITAASDDEAVATVSAATDGSSLTVSAQARGTATITVTADDGNGGTVEDEFTVTVKAAPVVASAIADVTGLEVGKTQDVSLSGVFSDADGDTLTITAASSNNAKATVTVASDGSKLTLTGVAKGSATITVTAEDSDGNTVSDTFDAPVAKKYAGLIADIYEWRNDPRYVNDKAHTDRWDRTLLTFGETVADTTLTKMTADEAQKYVDKGWERWEPVTAALREIEAGQSG